MQGRAFIFALAAALVLGIAAPAIAAIRITKIQYDPPGNDSGFNTSLNREFVVIKNSGNSRLSLTGRSGTPPAASLGPSRRRT